MIIIGEKIKELRKKSKFTQTELAQILGVTKSTVAAYENNTRLPSYDVLIKMAGIFKVSTDSLLLNLPDKKILEADGLKTDQLEMLEKLIVYFRGYNLMEEYANNCKNTQEIHDKKIQYDNRITKI